MSGNEPMGGAGGPTQGRWARRDGDGWVLSIRVQPGAGRSAVVGLHDGALKVKVAAPANEGKANAELVRYLAKVLGTSKQSVRLARGERSRVKTVEVAADITPLCDLVEGS